jgi:TrpR-related protein YerC/YecD
MKSHRNVSSSQEAQAERNLFAAVAALRNGDECRAFFRDLCTPAEIQAMADRWAVVDWLMQEVPYREINRLTGVSVTTISRVARCLADGNGGYSLIVRRTKAPRRGEPGRRVEAARHG